MLVVALLAIAGVFSGDDDDSDEGFGTPTATTITAPAPTEEPVAKRIPVGGRPDSISAGAGLVWIGDSFGGASIRGTTA